MRKTGPCPGCDLGGEMIDEDFGDGDIELAPGESVGGDSVVSGPVVMRFLNQKLN